MTDEGAALRRELVRAYVPYVEGRLVELGLRPPPGLAESLGEGRRWLDEALGELFETPFVGQVRSPLEVFQEAMRFPTEVLAGAVVPAIERDPVEEAALPGDRYRLAPASSQVLGDRAWRAHLAWGAAKARALRAGAVVWLGSDLMDRARVAAAVARTGRQLVAVADADALSSAIEGAGLLLVDLTHPEAGTALEAAAEAGLHPVAYGPHVEVERLASAQELGAVAMARSAFFGRLEDAVRP